MGIFKNRVGDRYGRLLVVSHSGKDKRNKHLWLCKCDCGNEKIIVSDNLSSGKSNSCGCLKSEFLANSGFQFKGIENREDAILKVQYSHLKRRHRNLDKDGVVIDFNTFKKLSKDECKYCGLEHSKIIEDRLSERSDGKKLSDIIIKINGIDRVNSAIGYTKENSVTCCKYCNFAKHTMSEDDFYKWIRKVYEFNFK